LTRTEEDDYIENRRVERKIINKSAELLDLLRIIQKHQIFLKSCDVDDRTAKEPYELSVQIPTAPVFSCLVIVPVFVCQNVRLW
jgi:hypothetical protein